MITLMLVGWLALIAISYFVAETVLRKSGNL